jgi:hypothetical protein
MKLYIGQTKLKIQLLVEANLAEVQSVKIKYEDPKGNKGEFPATVATINPGMIEYTIQDATEIDLVGTWKMWAFVTYADGKTAIGQTAEFKFHREGQ